MTGIDNLRAMFAQADRNDRAEGRVAYRRYGGVLRGFADHYGVDFDRTVAAFVALSPNNDYFSNLRSLASCLAHIDQPNNRIVVSTYNHCKDRALSYARGEVSFLATVKGPKVRAFYRNITRPEDPRPITVDGHIHAIWAGKNWTMREAIIRRKSDYERIADDVRTLARERRLKGNQAQATLWFARKRTLAIVYNPQIQLFADRGDLWETLITPAKAPPYPLKPQEKIMPTIQVQVDDETNARLSRAAAQSERSIVDLAESAIAEAALDWERAQPMVAPAAQLPFADHRTHDSTSAVDD